jgi:hypothetical protein
VDWSLRWSAIGGISFDELMISAQSKYINI